MFKDVQNQLRRVVPLLAASAPEPRADPEQLDGSPDPTLHADANPAPYKIILAKDIKTIFFRIFN